MENFVDLGLSPEITSMLEKVGYKQPTQVQKECIPLILRGSDVLACAPTGTGKTAAFCLPLIDILTSSPAKARMPRALILEPTRELAFQVVENLEKYSPKGALSYVLIMGGESAYKQQKLLNRGADIIIATPGRFLDLYEAGHIILTQTKFVVIDEADRMMDMGFIPDVRKITKALPPLRQTLLFSATMDKSVEKLSQEFLSNPKQVRVAAPSASAELIDQYVIHVPRAPREQQAQRKRDVLRLLIEQEKIKSAIIFCNRKCDVDMVYKFLIRLGHTPGLIHGDLTQSKRHGYLEKFKRKEVDFLIASNVAARGLHVDDLAYVINYDIPNYSEDYVHRIGRTGRAGQKGKAFTLVTDKDQEFLDKIVRLIKKPIPVAKLNFDELPAPEKNSRFSQEAPEKPTRDRPYGKSTRPKPSFGSKPSYGPKPNHGPKPAHGPKVAQEKSDRPAQEGSAHPKKDGKTLPPWKVSPFKKRPKKKF
ncbi:MAG: DEAD/DEAH box helicase [Alphaproteobacteria bacterium]